MRSLAKFFGIILVTAAVTGTMGYIGYTYFRGGDPIDTKAIQNVAAAPPPTEPESAVTTYMPDVSEQVKIGMDTQFTYSYKYTKDMTTKTSTTDAPYFLVGLTRDEVAQRLTGWEIVSFDKDEVVLEKEINSSNTENYTIGIKNGYVAVFYDEEINGSLVKEVTDKPVATLSIDEQARLEYGIRVSGEAELLKALEDYGS